MVRGSLNRIIAALALLCLTIAPWGAEAKPGKIKYAKTEVERARGKCVATIIGGALLGAVVGRVVGGKKNTAEGAVVGAAAGTVVCAILLSNAKRKDRIIAAQIASANYQSTPYRTYFADDNGQQVTFVGRGGASEIIAANRLQPVKYETFDGLSAASPVPLAAGQECRAINSAVEDFNGNRAGLPNQYVCRTADGNWQPYGLKKA
jgi:hypothetical protein